MYYVSVPFYLFIEQYIARKAMATCRLDPISRINNSTRDFDAGLFPRIDVDDLQQHHSSSGRRAGTRTRDAAGRVQQFTQRLARHVCVAVKSTRSRVSSFPSSAFAHLKKRGGNGARRSVLDF